MNSRCPHCHEDAPIVLRGIVPYCVSCDQSRPALGQRVVGASGKTAKYTGVAAKLAAFGVFSVGSILALFFVLLFQLALWPTGWLGWAIGIPIMLLTLLISGGLFLGGRALSKSGDRTIADTQKQAILALARRKRSGITPQDVAKALSISQKDADEALTALAQDPDEDVAIELTHDGQLIYLIESDVAARFRVRAADYDRSRDDALELELPRDAPKRQKTREE